ncbi:hypothetical protein ABK040_003324 [Willaertia magna]
MTTSCFLAGFPSPKSLSDKTQTISELNHFLRQFQLGTTPTATATTTPSTCSPQTSSPTTTASNSNNTIKTPTSTITTSLPFLNLPTNPILPSYYRNKLSYYKEYLRKQRLYSNTSGSVLLPQTIQQHSTSNSFSFSSSSSPVFTPRTNTPRPNNNNNNNATTQQQHRIQSNPNISNLIQDYLDESQYDKKWNLFREINTIQNQLNEISSQMSNFTNMSNGNQITKNDLSQLIIYLNLKIDLAQIYREYLEYSESFMQLEKILRILQNACQDGIFDPKLEIIYCKSLFLISVILNEKEKIQESEEYLQSAKERISYLFKLIYNSKMEHFVINAVHLLISEINLYITENYLFKNFTKNLNLPKNKFNDEIKVLKILNENLITSLKNILNFNGKKIIISNLEIFRLTCFYIGFCLFILKEDEISIQFLNLSKITSPNINKNLSQDKLTSNNGDKNEIHISLDEKLKSLLKEIEIQQQQALQQQETKRKLSIAAASSTTTSSSFLNKNNKWNDDDWDDEMDDDLFDDIPKHSEFAKLLLNNNGDEQEELEQDILQSEIFPLKYRLFKSRSFTEQDVNLPQCVLTGDLINNNSSGFSNKLEFKKWTQQLFVNKNTLLKAMNQQQQFEMNNLFNNNTHNNNKMSISASVSTVYGLNLLERLEMDGEQLCNLYDEILLHEGFSTKFIKLNVELCQRIYYISVMEFTMNNNNNNEYAISLQKKCVEIINNYFTILKRCKPLHNSIPMNFLNNNNQSHNKLPIHTVNTSEDLLSKLNDINDKTERRSFLFLSSINILTVAANLFHPEQEDYNQFILTLKDWFPSQAIYLQLLRIQAIIKFHKRLVKLENSIPHESDIKKVFQDLIEIFEKGNKSYVYENRNSTNNYNQQQHGGHNTQSQQHGGHHNINNNNTARGRGVSYAVPKLSDDEKLFYPNMTAVMTKVILLIHKYHIFWKNTMKELMGYDFSKSIPEIVGNNFNHLKFLFNEKERITYLIKRYYLKLPISLIKAEAASIIGNYWLKEKEDRILAECVLFESVYIYFKVQSLGYPIFITKEGLKSIKKFAEILYLNDKYEYSSIFYEIFVNNYKMLFGKYDYQLIDELTSITMKNDDYYHSIKYFQILFEKAKEERKLPQIARIATKLSNLYMEKGDFIQAENIKMESICFAKKFTTLVDYKTDLEIELANLLIISGNLDKSITILYSVAQEQPNKRHLIYEMLSNIYLKKRWFAECEDCLTELSNVIETFYISLNLQQEMKILEIVTNYYFKRNLFGNALDCVNIALNRPNTTFPILANLFKLKGKILKAICNYSTHMTFPCVINETNNEELHPIVQLITDKMIINNLNNFTQNNNNINNLSGNNNYLYSKRPTYYCMQEFLQDCLDCFLKSKSYYEAYSNEIGITKINLLISETFLDYLFIPIALLNKNPETYIRLKDQLNENAKYYKDLKNYLNNNGLLNEINLDDIYNNYIVPALDTSIKSSDIFLSLNAYLSTAECKFLQGKISSSKAYWCECRDVFVTLFINHDGQVCTWFTPSYLEKLLIIVKRMIRIFTCYEINFINDHLGIFEIYYLLESNYNQQLKKLPKLEIINKNKDQEELIKNYYNNYFLSNLDKLIGNQTNLIDSDKQLLSKNKIFEILYKRNGNNPYYNLNNNSDNNLNLNNSNSKKNKLLSPHSNNNNNNNPFSNNNSLDSNNGRVFNNNSTSSASSTKSSSSTEKSSSSINNNGGNNNLFNSLLQQQLEQQQQNGNNTSTISTSTTNTSTTSTTTSNNNPLNFSNIMFQSPSNNSTNSVNYSNLYYNLNNLNNNNNNNNGGSGELSLDQLHLKIIERVTSCLIAMKQANKKYYNEVHNRLRKRNQECMRRLYNVMNAIRESNVSIIGNQSIQLKGWKKKHSNLNNNNNNSNLNSNFNNNNFNSSNLTPEKSSPRLQTNLLNSNHMNSQSFIHSPRISNVSAMPSSPLSPRPSPIGHQNNYSPNQQHYQPTVYSPTNFNQQQQQHNNNNEEIDNNSISIMMDILPGDVTLMEMLIKTINLQKITKLKGTIQKTMNVHLQLERKITKYNSLTPDLTCLENFRRIIKIYFEHFIYILYIDNLILFYIPKEGIKIFIPFGGRDHSILDSLQNKKNNVIDLNSNTTTQNDNNSDLSNIGNNLNVTKKMGREMTFDKLEMTNKILNWNLIHLNKEMSQLDEYLLNLITINMRDEKNLKKKFNFEEFENILKKVFYSKTKGNLIFNYQPNLELNNLDNLEFNNNLDESHLKKKELNFSFKNYFNNQKKLTSTLTFRKKSNQNIPKLEELPNIENPIFLFCNFSLQIIPWEVLFENQSVTRCSNLNQLKNTLQKKKKTKFNNLQFYSFYSEDEQKYILNQEQEKKELTYEDLQNKLNLRRIKSAGRVHKEIYTIPCHMSIIKHGKKPTSSAYRKKYEFIHFIELSKLFNNPNNNLFNNNYNNNNNNNNNGITSGIGEIGKILDKWKVEVFKKDKFSIFLLNWCDLVNLPEILFYLNYQLNNCCLLFIPEMLMKKAVTYLGMLLEIYGPQIEKIKSSSTTNNNNSNNNNTSSSSPTNSPNGGGGGNSGSGLIGASTNISSSLGNLSNNNNNNNNSNDNNNNNNSNNNSGIIDVNGDNNSSSGDLGSLERDLASLENSFSSTNNLLQQQQCNNNNNNNTSDHHLLNRSNTSSTNTTTIENDNQLLPSSNYTSFRFGSALRPMNSILSIRGKREELEKRNNIYKFIMFAVNILRDDFEIPVAVYMNPPPVWVVTNNNLNRRK